MYRVIINLKILLYTRYAFLMKTNILHINIKKVKQKFQKKRNFYKKIAYTQPTNFIFDAVKDPGNIFYPSKNQVCRVCVGKHSI